MDSTVITGYGPLDLIEQLKKKEWVPCSSDGQNFMAISLGGYCFTDTPDELCNIKYQLTIENKTTGKEFTIKGFCFKSMPIGFSINAKDDKGPFPPNKFAGHILSKREAGHILSKRKYEDQAFYMVELEVLQESDTVYLDKGA